MNMDRGDLAGQGYSIEVKEYEPDRRPKCFYYRKCGMQVGPWPCDERSQKYYLNKGFLLDPPQKVERKPVYKCQICGKHYEHLSSLIGCLRKHNKEVTNGIS
jgi:hypothetical protein